MGNPDFRKALSVALDREALAQQVFRGEAMPINSIIPAPLAENNAAVPLIKQDQAAARELLQRAGYKGEEIELAFYAGISVFTPLAKALQAQWKEVGINTKLDNKGPLYGGVLGNQQYTMGVGFGR